jgi:hypothetical protein
MITSVGNNETPRLIPPRPLNDLKGLQSTSSPFDATSGPTEHSGERTYQMTARNDARGLLVDPQVPLALNEVGQNNLEWTQGDRDALALGLYLFKADPEVISSIVGSKTVRTPKIVENLFNETRERLKPLPACERSFTFYYTHYDLYV